MAHWLAPRPGPLAGYDADNKLAPGSLWRMQVPVGEKREVVLWGGKDLWVRSNNPNVMRDADVSAVASGNDKRVTLYGWAVGTTNLDSGVGSSYWVTLQVQVTAKDGTVPTLRDATRYFVKPSWSPNFDGAKSTSDNRLWRQEINLGGRSNVGLMGVTSWRNVNLVFDNTRVASIEKEEAVSANMGEVQVAFKVVGLTAGNAELTAYVDGKAVASMQVAVTTTTASNAIYADNFLNVYYDVDYRHQGGNYSKYLILRYIDDVAIDLHLDRILDAKMDPDQASDLIARSAPGDGGKKFPQQLNASTTPRLVAAKQAALQAMNEEFFKFLIVAETVVEFVMAALQVAQIAGRIAAIRTVRPRAGLPPPVKQVISSGGSKIPRVTPSEVEEALAEARREHATTTVYHGGTLSGDQINSGRYFSTTTDLEYAQAYAKKNGGQVYRYEIPTARLKELENLNKQGQPGVRVIQDSLAGQAKNAPEYRFDASYLSRGGATELGKYRVPLAVP